MTRAKLNAACASLPHATHVVQWGESDVWKIGGKVFAIIGDNASVPSVTFKVTPIAYEMLKDERGC